jgi:hypothetical protein
MESLFITQAYIEDKRMYIHFSDGSMHSFSFRYSEKVKELEALAFYYMEGSVVTKIINNPESNYFYLSFVNHEYETHKYIEVNHG